MTKNKLLAWGVHLYTASGGVLGMFALFAATEEHFRTAFLLIIVTMLIDATDGMMARRCKVGKVLSGFDGGAMDNVIDILNFAWLPIYIIGVLDVLPHPAWVILPTLSALYYYGQTDAKTDDGFFTGWPCYWSVVALYFYWLQPHPMAGGAIVLLFTVLTFIPTRYLYPSKGDTLWRTSWGLGAIWFGMVIYLLVFAPDNHLMMWLSLFYPVFYMLASFQVDYQMRRTQ
jgi:phosphatidylcholine synthase